MAASNGTSSAAHNARSIGSGCSSRSRESRTGPPNSAKISAWAAILFAPTLVGTIYGMNFDHMPELHWELGYPFALALMISTSIGLYLSFKRRGWI